MARCTVPAAGVLLSRRTAMASVITAVMTARLRAASAAQLRSCCRSGRQATARALPCAGAQPAGDYTVRVILGQD